MPAAQPPPPQPRPTGYKGEVGATCKAMNFLQPPADAPRYRHHMTKAEARDAVHTELGVRWYHCADKPRTVARERTRTTGVVHFVVALDYGNLVRSADGTVRRAGVLNAKGEVVGAKMFLPFTQPTLASFIDSVRLDSSFGPSCCNLYEEANTDRPRRVGFDLEFELSHVLKDGTLDHKTSAEALWPTDFAGVAASAELFLGRVLVARVLPAFNQLAGTSLTTRDCYALDSSSATKLSFHFALPAVLPTKTALELFAEWMRATFKDCDAPLAPLLDVGVYAESGNMRLPLNRKPFKPGAATDKPCLRPVSRVGTIQFADTHDGATPDGRHSFTLSLLQQHMWTIAAAAPHAWAAAPDLEERLRFWKQMRSPQDPRQPTAAPPTKRKTTGSGDMLSGEDPKILHEALSLYALHKRIPASSVALVSHTLRHCDDSGATAGNILVRVGDAATRLHVSARGNVYLAGANDTSIAVALVERALAPSRADSFVDWYAVGGALHTVDPSPAMFAVWDHFSQQCPAKYDTKECRDRWASFNGKVSLGTLIYKGREDNDAKTAAILRSAPSVLLGRLGGPDEPPPSPATGPQPPPETPELATTRHLLRVVLGDVTSEPKAVRGTWNGSWAAPPGRRCCNGIIHDAESTFETCIADTHPCSSPGCSGTVGGFYWSSRTCCATCSTKHCAVCQLPKAAGHVCAAAAAERVARGRLSAQGTVYETCHACRSPTPAVLGPLQRTIPCTALPVSADVYATAVAAQRPTWAICPCPLFTTAHHTFLALFTITECGQVVHGDGRRRVLGVTSASRVVLGVKHQGVSRNSQAKPYAWTSVESWFREPLRAWFLREHAGTAALLPPPEERPPRPQLWTLPCCESTTPCSRKKCRTQTHEPWLWLRQLKAHGQGGEMKL